VYHTGRAAGAFAQRNALPAEEVVAAPGLPGYYFLPQSKR